MANQTSAAGNNGVSGATGGISGGNTAVRTSVAKTSKGYGSAVSASSVYSETKNLRFAYHPVEADAPARDRS
jgi:hypothetical protein|tara:strand:- start:1054 stop:1269 length:216 start_codon:yes stop_codon:yes gene_type:complete